MRRLRQWLIRLTTSMTRRHDETRLRQEIDDYVAFETDENLRRGLPQAEARRSALLTFGSVETFKERYRDQQGVPALEHLLQDVRIAFRRMWTTPGFTVAAIGTLALGLGLTSAVMSLAGSNREICRAGKILGTTFHQQPIVTGRQLELEAAVRDEVVLVPSVISDRIGRPVRSPRRVREVQARRNQLACYAIAQFDPQAPGILDRR